MKEQLCLGQRTACSPKQSMDCVVREGYAFAYFKSRWPLIKMKREMDYVAKHKITGKGFVVVGVLP